MGEGGSVEFMHLNSGEPPPRPATRWLSAGVARDTVVALEMESGPDRLGLARLATVLVVAALIVVATVQVDVTARAPGLVRSRTENSELRSPAAGVVAVLSARPGQHVKAGETLLRLASPLLEERLDALGVRWVEADIACHDWAVLIDRVQNRPIGETCRDDFRSRWASLLWLDFLAQDEALGLAEAKASREAQRLSQLGAQGLVTARDLDDARHELAVRRAARTGARDRHLAIWHERLRDADSLLAQNGIEQRLLERERDGLTLRSPLTGEILDFLSLEEGSVVTAGQTVGRVSADDQLQIEAYVPARVAALVRPGQITSTSFSALPPTVWGYVGGRVESIAADAMRASAEPLFRVVVRPLRGELSTPGGQIQPLRKGFTADVRFHLGRTTLLTLLRTKTADWIDRPPATPAVESASTRAGHFPSPRNITSGGPGYPGKKKKTYENTCDRCIRNAR